MLLDQRLRGGPRRRALTSAARSTLRAALSLVAVLAACTYGPIEERTSVGQIVRLGDSYQALVVVRYDRFRPPTGLSAFPDGGKARVLARRASVYLVDAVERTVARLAERPAPDALWESYDVSIDGVEGDSVAYLRLSGCPRGGECYPGPLLGTRFERVTRSGDSRVVARPPDVGLPGEMVARRPGEERYVRFSTRGDTVVARFEDNAPYEPAFLVRPDGSLDPVPAPR